MKGRAGGRAGTGRANVAIKDSAESWVRGKPVLAMVVVAVVGIVVGGLVGLGVGYKIEKSRTRSDVQRLQKKIKDAGIVNPDAPIKARVGTVSSVNGSTLDVRTTKQGLQKVTAAAGTPYEKAVPAATSDIAVGRRVLVAKGGKEVIILASTSPLGRVVSNVASDTFTVTDKNGKPVKVKLSNLKQVYKLTTAQPADAKVGTLVLAGGRGAGANGFAAVEIIVLPAGSAFAAA
jgi:hypothetical protein